MRNHPKNVLPVDCGKVFGPYVENVACPSCKELNPKGADNCNGCQQMLPVNA